MMTKKVYFVGSMAHTPWKDEPRFRNMIDVEIVAEPNEADFFVSRERKCFSDELLSLNKPNVIWTHEPNLEKGHLLLEEEDGNHFIVFSMYANNIYIDNFLYAPRDLVDPVTADALNADFDDKKIGILSTFRERKRIVAGKDVSLDTIRSQLALKLHEEGRATIMGSNWPNDVAAGNSREGNWDVSKKHFLADYNWSLCLENTCWRNYTSEKIWQAIQGHCLPIYYDNGSIYDVFPENSFIDYSKLKDHRELLNVIDQMSLETWLDRLNTCIRVYNQAVLLEKRMKSEILMFKSVKRYMSTIEFVGRILAEKDIAGIEDITKQSPEVAPQGSGTLKTKLRNATSRIFKLR